MTVELGVWYPENPPALPDEDADAYTDRLTGADRTGRVPHDHKRNRQCSIGYHHECSERHTEVKDRRCECPRHEEEGELTWLLGCVVNTLRGYNDDPEMRSGVSVSFAPDGGWEALICHAGVAFIKHAPTPYRALEACANEAFRKG